MNQRPVPDIETFTQAVKKYRGHKYNIAASFGVERHTLNRWLADRPDYAAIVEDARRRMLDDTIENAWLFANGIKDIQDGKFVGWLERPDGQTMRYLMSTLGREEGFGERIEVDSNVKTQRELECVSPEEAKRRLKDIEKQIYGRPLTKEESEFVFEKMCLDGDYSFSPFKAPD